ncbi:chaperonin 10-like protein [Podospora australis]|uniref:Chaperonin 10-like protein n=1 Tax=Podospora australis TaxID=1536484 RepID=A0AAN7AE07_9PEZI|nr:chaperonin 10-like protein [Podospora australis]
MSQGSSSARKGIQQYVATRKGGPFQLIDAPYPVPGPNEICIRNRAVGLNALDWKNLHFGMMVENWPEIFGIDTAGVVEVVGENVTDIKAGDAVMSLAGHGGRAGAFQDVTTVPANYACRKPAAWTFEQAASVPICYLTAVATIIKGLGVPLPHLREPTKGEGEAIPNLDDLISPIATRPPQHLPKPAQINSVLVVGGSSGVGACAIQLLRNALPNLVIISTNSPAHKYKVTSGLGANTWVDRNLKPSEIAKAVQDASPQGKGVDAIIDAVSGAQGGANKAIFDSFRPDGPKLYSYVMTSMQKVEVPNGVKAAMIYGRMAFQTDGGGFEAMTRLADFVDKGDFKLPVEIEVVGKGLSAIGGGLEKLRRGVSGTKLVVSL